jgi:antitoxin Phd
MPEKISIAQAKNNFTTIIQGVETGPAVQITRRGKPVAMLVSLKEYERLSRRQNNFYDAMMAFRQSLEEDGVEMTGEEFEGLRDKTIGRDVEL